MDVKSSTIRSCSSAEEMAAGIVSSSFAKVSMTDDGFECNICLEFAQEPVVTLCGHLYCWPCIYRWLRVHPSSQPCPVCKSTISTSMLIPLYGRGNTDMKKMNDKTIPSRPTANSPHHLQPSLTSEADHDYNYHDHNNDHDHDHNYHQAREDFSMSSPYRAATSMSPLFGGIAVSVFPWLAGNISQGFYYSSNHGNGGQLYFMGSGPSSSRMRRREEETKRCLSMVFVFLLCFAVWCLLFF